MYLYGTNNIAAGTPQATFTSTYQSMLTDTRTKFPSTKIVVLKIIPRFDANAGGVATYNGYIATAVTNVADANTTVLDVSAGLVTSDYSDGVLHPNASGYTKITNNLVPFAPFSTTGFLVSGGATTGPVGAASSAFTVTRTAGTFNGLDTITLSASDGSITATAVGGSISNNGTGNVTVTPASIATSCTFTYTPSSTGNKTITFTNGQGWTNPAADSFTATVSSSISLDAASIALGSTGNTVHVTGTSTSFTGTPFTLSGGSGASISSQTVTDSLHATLVISAGTATGTLTIHDTGSGSTAALSVQDTTAPTVPSGLMVIASNQQNVLHWNASTDPDDSVASYKVYRGGSLLTTVSASATTYTDSGLTNDTSYSYTVSAVDSNAEESAQSTAVTGTPTLLIAMPSPPDRTTYPIVTIAGVDDLGPITPTGSDMGKYVLAPVVNGPTTVTLTSPYLNSEIRYTKKGGLGSPNPSSLLYTGPIPVNENLTGSDRTVIKARIYDKTNSNLKSKIIRIEFRVH